MAATPAPGAVPAPADMAAEVVVSGRTSTLRRIDVECVGDRVPRTYAPPKVGNTRGFSWWVSRHWALKTDYPAEKARHYLGLLEMAYPHYVELFGRELPDWRQKRLAVCYASSEERLRSALASDGLRWDFDGGGITFEGYYCAYVYPSGTLDYHQRYILLHECAHLYQMCMAGTNYSTPPWYYEGVADALASHVYDSARNRLTVHVVDKPTTHDYLDEGMAALRRTGLTARQIHDGGDLGRGLTFLLANFFLTDPDRCQRLRIWRDEMIRLGRQHNTDESAMLLERLLGPWDRINADFRAWAAATGNTFHYAAWGWEQDADTLWSYGFAKDGKLSQTDVYLAPGDRPVHNPLRMDYPLQPMSPLVGPVERGTAEPAVGCLIDFSRCPGRGRAGMGLGLVSEAGVAPLPADALFADQAATRPGVKVTAYRLGNIRGQGADSTDVYNGPRLGESIDPRVALDLERSITRGLKHGFVVEWDGWLRVPREDHYTFATTSDDGSWLWIDDALVVRNGGRHDAATASGTIRLPAGMHKIRIRYFQDEGRKAFDVGLMAGERPGCLKILVERGEMLSIDGSDMGLEPASWSIPADVRSAMAAGGHRVGLTVRIARASLEATLRASASDAARPAELKASMPITQQHRTRLLRQPMTILARDGWHGITPYFDDRRRPEPDLDRPASPNRWRNPGDKALASLYRAAWALGTKTPPSLAALKDAMLAAVDKDPPVQQAAVERFRRSIAGVLKDVAGCGAGPEAVKSAADALAEGAESLNASSPR